MTVTVRDAVEADVPAIVDIFNQVLLTSDAIWLDEPVSFESRLAWFRTLEGQGMAVVVAVDDEVPADAEAHEVVGYGSFQQFRTLAGYHPTVEHSLHVRDGHRGKGIGLALLDALTDRARTLGKAVQVAGLDAGNEGSQRFHQRLGFVEVARMPGIGRKQGRPVDLVLLQRNVPDRPGGPHP